ncbi:glycoside hydrolase family 43 protein [Duganella callida]|uniref:Glycosyl hydrolase 43 family protein n=1 Tax=Duganella callida TaxID=2561932 RepID=A0A4Y9S6H7_9BURK|nr:glycoside hydrolase 43 family protein [Duganella callida]TFW16818.1 glycosyl hydrolase 43 family protein [Duganella callida]
MRKLAVAWALALACASGTAGTYANPVLYADYSDPDVIRVDDDYYLVASSFHFSPGIPVLKSKDLVHWKIVGHVLPKLDFHPAYDMSASYPLTDAVSKPVGDGLRYAGGVWAPAIRFHNGLFYVYWATPNEGIFMSSSRDPAGAWSTPVTVLAGPGYEDPCPFWDDDGKAWLIHSRVGAGPGILHAMSPDGKTLLDAGKTIVEDRVNLPVFEGPKFYKRNGYYYIFAPIGGVGSGPQAVLRARRIDGPYESRTVLQPGNGLSGPHQGGYVETPAGEGWFMHFNSTGAFGRIVHLQPVTWRDDWPVMGDAGLPVPSHAAPRTATLSPAQLAEYRLQDSDEFSSAQLGLQWSWNHNPDDRRWSLTQRPGFLRIHASQSQYLVGARNTLTQILQGPQSEIVTRLELGGMVDSQRAGLSLFGVKVPWLGVVREGGTNYLTYSNAGVETRGAQLAANAVLLRAVVKPDQTVQFSYALAENGPYTDIGPVTELAKFSWWKGSRPAVFTYTKSAAAGYIDVDWFRVTH